jgi:hypothetical protein
VAAAKSPLCFVGSPPPQHSQFKGIDEGWQASSGSKADLLS